MEWEENPGSLVHTYSYSQEVGNINNTHKKGAPTAKAALGKWWTNPWIIDWKHADAMIGPERRESRENPQRHPGYPHAFER